ncbi:MAG: bile acid:sodium symporter, partial [Bacteroidota bacterium]
SVVTMFSVPFLVNLGLRMADADGGVTALPFLPTAGRIFVIVLIPVTLGIIFRAYFPKIARKLQLYFRWISVLLLALVFIIKVFAPVESGGSALTLTEVGQILPASLLVNVAALSVGFLLTRAFRFRINDQLTMGVEIGIQNTSLAFLIAATLLHNEDMLKPALVYATFSFLTAFAYGLLLKPKEWQVIKREFKELKRRIVYG